MIFSMLVIPLVKTDIILSLQQFRPYLTFHPRECMKRILNPSLMKGRQSARACVESREDRPKCWGCAGAGLEQMRKTRQRGDRKYRVGWKGEAIESRCDLERQRSGTDPG